MKIEWANESLNEATISKGWFRKVHAQVYRDYSDWRYTPSCQYVGRWLNYRLTRARREANWQEVKKLPEAKCVT